MLEYLKDWMEYTTGCLESAENTLQIKYTVLLRCHWQEGKYLVTGKKGNIVPIYKGGKNEDLLNYRSVSLTNLIAKICEKTV